MDCFKLVAEISFLLGKIKPLLAEFEEENNVIQTMPIGLVISRYFQAFVLANSSFHAQPPPPFKLPKRCCSV